jgi:hypothetical protein
MPGVFATLVVAAMLAARLLSVPVILIWPVQAALARLRAIALRRALLARRSSRSERTREGRTAAMLFVGQPQCAFGRLPL